MIPIYAVVSFLSYLYYHNAIYFELIRDCYEAFAIASFFTLMCHYIAPNLHDQKNYFRDIQPKNWVWPMNWMQKCSGGQDKGWLRRPRSGLTWFNVRSGNNSGFPSNVCRLYGSVSFNTASFAPSSPSSLSLRNLKVDTVKAQRTPDSLTFGSRFSKPSRLRSLCIVSFNFTYS
jgi:hypothetical protein